MITNWTFKYRQLRGKEPLPKGTKFRVSDSTMLYAGAGAHAANVWTLNAGSTWTAYNRITDRGITWYELGGNQWVQAKGGALLDPTRRNQVVHQNAIVKILHGAATIFNTPSAGRTSLDRRPAKTAVGGRLAICMMVRMFGIKSALVSGSVNTKEFESISTGKLLPVLIFACSKIKRRLHFALPSDTLYLLVINGWLSKTDSPEWWHLRRNLYVYEEIEALDTGSVSRIVYCFIRFQFRCSSHDLWDIRGYLQSSTG
ncbi:hypothetical protein [Schleiferilactobacillus harbinensis]|uniref:Uncharacterized protein n=1 Tax=Schleiferilactobacillus harbinensis DSM 16991 TaxID=1122147 RepID=A0A0R1XG39_9LACO|nr:hypothetical protein [Schleiferilactobacillus harbinensis]KRM29103.1 hypothetical protein FC91_GL001060 [Schleiferilactobacillus harbinensis DSM 16991]